MGKQKINPKQSGAAEPSRWMQAAFLSLLALSAAALCVSPWAYAVRSQAVDHFLPSLEIVGFNLQQLLRLQGQYASTLWGWTVFLSISSLFYLAGSTALKKFEERISPLEFISISWFLGTWMFAMLWLLLGSLGLFKGPVGTGLILAGIPLLLFYSWKIGSHIKNTGSFKPGLAELGIAAISLWVLSWSLQAIFPQYYWDTLMMNMAIPGWYVAEGTFHPNIFHVYTYFAQNGELLSVWPLLAHSKEAAYLLNWGFFAFSAMFIYGWIERAASRTMGLYALAILVGTPLAEWTVLHIKNDWQVGIFLILQWWALLHAFKKHTEDPPDAVNWLFLAGVFGGISYGYKFIAVPPIFITYLGVFAFFSCHTAGEKKWHAAAKLQGIFTLGLLLSCGPWLIRNLIIAKNPFYPFLNGLFGAEHLFPWHDHPGTTYRLFSTGWTGAVDYLRDMVQVFPSSMGGVPIWLGPTALLGLLGVLCAFQKEDGELSWVGGIAVLSWIFSLFFALKPVTHMGPLIFVLVVCSAFAVHSLLQRSRSRWLGAAVLLVVSVGFIRNWNMSITKGRVLFCTSAAISGNPVWHYVSEMDTETKTLASIDEMNWLHHLLNKYSQPSEGVLLLGSVRPYGIERKHIASISFGQQPILYYAQQCKDEFELRDLLLSMGVRHIVSDISGWMQFINNEIVDAPNHHDLPLNADDLQKIDRFMIECAVPRFSVPTGRLQWFSIKKDDRETFAPLQFDGEDVRRFPYQSMALAGEFRRKGESARSEAIMNEMKTFPLVPDLRSALQKQAGISDPAK